MLRIWAKLWKRGRMTENITVQDDHTDLPLADRISLLLEEIIHKLDLARPIFLKSNEKELKTYGATKFTQDHFIEDFPYQSLEIEIIEMDEDQEAKKNE